MIDPWHIWTVIYMIDVRRIWNVIYNARSNRSHPPTAPNTAPATQNDCDDWSASHMKRHLQCAEQQESSSNCTKYCTCHAKWLWWLIRVTYETSFTMRGATGVILQLHQILHLPRKMTVMIDPRHIWNVIYNERSNRNHNPSSPNTAPATQNESQDWSASHMKRHLQCAEQQPSQDKFTKMNLKIDPRHIWNVIYNARSNNRHRTSSPNTAPATQNESHDCSASHMKRHLQCAEQAQSASNLTKYCACHEICKFKISAETPWSASANRKTIRADSEDNPRIIRAWNRHLAPAASETLLAPSWRRILYGKIQHFAFRLSIQISRSAAPATKSDTPTSPNTAPATQNESHDWSASHMKRHLQCAEQAQSASNLTKYCACHEICKFKISAETPWSASANRKTIRADSEDNPRIIRG